MIRVVLDTNVVVSAVLSPVGPNAQLMDLVLQDKIRIFITPAVAEEYTRVFEHEHLKHLDKRRVARFLRLLLSVATLVKPTTRLKISLHEDDNRIYECALAAKAHFIVTGNTKHFPTAHKYTKIITARQLLRRIDAE